MTYTPKIVTTFRADQILITELELYSTKHSTTVSKIIRLAISNYLMKQVSKERGNSFYE